MGDHYSPDAVALPGLQTTPPADDSGGTVSRAREMNFRDGSPQKSPPMDTMNNLSRVQ